MRQQDTAGSGSMILHHEGQQDIVVWSSRILQLVAAGSAAEAVRYRCSIRQQDISAQNSRILQHEAS
jgi:hypothetical protein